MNSIKTYVTVWLSGLIAGLILVERWRRTGGRVVAGEEIAGAALETGTSMTASTASADKTTAKALVVAGVKADAQRARHLLERVGPWTNTSAARFIKAGRSTPEATPPPPNSPDVPA